MYTGIFLNNYYGFVNILKQKILNNNIFLYKKILLKEFNRQLALTQRAVVNPRSHIARIVLDNKITYFEISDFMKFSKKTNRTVSFQKQDKEVLQYSYVGKAIKFNSNFISSTVRIRNSHMLYSYEMSFHIFSHTIITYSINQSKYKKHKYLHGKNYNLRKKTPIFSFIPFAFGIPLLVTRETTYEEYADAFIEYYFWLADRDIDHFAFAQLDGFLTPDEFEDLETQFDTLGLKYSDFISQQQNEEENNEI